MASTTVPLSDYLLHPPTNRIEALAPEVIEVVVPFNSATVREAVDQAKAIVSDLTPDDIAGLSSILAAKASRAELIDAVAAFDSTALSYALIFG